MAVTLDATLGGNQSNSYITLANAEGIAGMMPGGDTWIALTEDEKNMSLIQATRWLETLDYRGDRCSTSQRLKWARSGAECDGVTSDCSGIPYPIQEAEVVLAIKYSESPWSVPRSRWRKLISYWHLRQTPKNRCFGDRIRRILQPRIQQL